MKLKSLLLFVIFFGVSSIVTAPGAKAEEFLCQAQKNAYDTAVAAFNSAPSLGTAQAVAQAQANYQNCVGLNTTPGG